MEIRKYVSNKKTIGWDSDAKCDGNKTKLHTYLLGDNNLKWYAKDFSIVELPLKNCWSSIYEKNMKNYINYNEGVDTIKGKLNISTYDLHIWNTLRFVC